MARILVLWHVFVSIGHLITSPSGDRNERNLHWLVANFLQVNVDFNLDLVVTDLFGERFEMCPGRAVQGMCTQIYLVTAYVLEGADCE